MKQILKFSALWLSGSVIFSILILKWLYSSKLAIYGTNDDELISSIFNGFYGQSNSQKLIFIQPLLTYPLNLISSFFVLCCPQGEHNKQYFLFCKFKRLLFNFVENGKLSPHFLHIFIIISF